MKIGILNNPKVVREIKVELEKSALFNAKSKEMLESINKSEITDDQLAQKFAFHLPTLRNQNLISEKQQNVLRSSNVVFMGMSVGSHAVANWVMQSRPDRVSIADHDIVSPSNLNRLRYGWKQVGRRKIDVVREELREMHPYLDLKYTHKTDQENISKFLTTMPMISAVVDAIDDFEGKIFLRKFCQKKAIPLLSAADVGDMVILDIERYDITPQPELFLGRIPVKSVEEYSNLSEMEKKKLIIELVGLDKNSDALLHSLLAIGKTISTWPQLGATANMAGGIIALALKKIFLGEKVKSGRYLISLDEILVDGFTQHLGSPSYQNLKTRVEKKFHL